MQQMTKDKLYIGAVALTGFLLCCSSFGILYMHWLESAYSERQSTTITKFELEQYVKNTLVESCEQFYRNFRIENTISEINTLRRVRPENQNLTLAHRRSLAE